MMSDLIHELYQSRVYPAMSHPRSDPAMSAVAAIIGGLEVVHPRSARILEIGCYSGHHLIPLAMRWPGSECTGIDLSERAVDEANHRAKQAGVRNVRFYAANLLEFQPENGLYDYIIAHGFFSWVPDDVKAKLFAFFHRHLAPSGIATVSFNVESGWKLRQHVIAKVRAIQQAGGGDVISSLLLLKSFTETDHPDAVIIDDMLAKGSSILACDDFAPVNDPWRLDRFVHAAAHAGLKWLGESDPSENIPNDVDEAELIQIKGLAKDPLQFQVAVDEATGRTFRSGILCRDDASVAAGLPLDRLLDFFVSVNGIPTDRNAMALHDAIHSFSPACVSVHEVIRKFSEPEKISVMRQLFEGISRGWIRPRIEPVNYSAGLPTRPKLDAFRLICAHQKQPLVDAWHKSCDFPAEHFPILSAMDGSRTYEELGALAVRESPTLAFNAWMRHLSHRGMFAAQSSTTS